MSAGADAKPLIAALRREVQQRPPLWLMRQAGRYLPEYRALRARAGSFLDLCYDPALAVEASLQPLQRFALDGAILFSDILVVAEALGLRLWFEDGEGPRLEPVREGDTLPVFDGERQRRHLAPVYAAMERVAAAVPEGVAVLGFAGAPWTLATYMVGGGRSRDFSVVKGWAYRDPQSFRPADRDAARGGRGASDRTDRRRRRGRADIRQLGGCARGSGVPALVYRAHA